MEIYVGEGKTRMNSNELPLVENVSAYGFLSAGLKKANTTFLNRFRPARG